MNIEKEIQFAIEEYVSQKVSGMMLHDAKDFYLKILVMNNHLIVRFIDKDGVCRCEILNPKYDYSQTIKNTIEKYQQIEAQRKKFLACGFTPFRKEHFRLTLKSNFKFNLYWHLDEAERELSQRINQVRFEAWNGSSLFSDTFFSQDPYGEFIQSLKSFPLEIKMGFNEVLRDELFNG